MTAHDKENVPALLKLLPKHINKHNVKSTFSQCVYMWILMTDKGLNEAKTSHLSSSFILNVPASLREISS
jgi:hypothetical protein